MTGRQQTIIALTLTFLGFGLAFTVVGATFMGGLLVICAIVTPIMGFSNGLEKTNPN